MTDILFYRGDSSKYNHTEMQDSIYFAKDTNAIISNQLEYGTYPQDFAISTSGTEVEYKVFCQNYSPNSQRFAYETEIDFSKGDFIQVEIDLSKSTKTNGINAISIGEDITSWGNNILWVFYNVSKPWQGGNNILLQYTNPNGDSPTRYKIFDTKSIFVLKVSLKGVYVNDVKITEFPQSTISPLTSLSKIQIGSNRNDDSDTLSDATYKKVALYKLTDANSIGITYKSNSSVTKYIELPTVSEISNGLLSYQDKIKLDSMILGGINEVATLVDVPISKSYVYATLSTDETLSIDLDSYKESYVQFPNGSEVKIIVKNNSNNSIIITLPYDDYICFEKTLTIDSGKYAIITVYIKSITELFITCGSQISEKQSSDVECVDLGLPSGTQWMKYNIGATKESDYGLYFQWGSIVGYSSDDAADNSIWSTCPGNGGAEEADDDALYAWDADNLTDGVLNTSVDAVYQATNGKAKMPTREQVEELINYTTTEWATLDGNDGTKFINKNDKSKYIFIPASGRYNEGDKESIGENSDILTSTIFVPNESATQHPEYSYYMYAWKNNIERDGKWKHTDMDYYNRCNAHCVRGVLI